MKIIALIISVLFFSPLMGQKNLLYPDMFAGFFNHQSLFNPAFQQDTGRAIFSASLKSRTGAFKNIATYYASIERTFMNEKKSGHTIRLFFFNEKEGPYIEKPRGYINYAYRLAVSDHTSLSSGASIGFTQLAYTAPSATATGSVTLPDASIGLYIKRKNLRAGISSMQLLNNSSSASNLSVKLGRYYNFFVAMEKPLGYSWKMNTYLLYRMLPVYNDNVDLALLLTFKNSFVLGSSARYKLGTSFFISFNIKTNNSLININFAYNTPLLSGITSLNNSYEISPSYIIH